MSRNKPAISKPPSAAAWWLITAALACGFLSIVVQWIGLLVAIFMPFDSQGAVGKAFAALFTQFAAIPLALAAIVLVIVARIVAGRFTYRLQLALWCAVGGLVPLSMGYVALVR